MNIKNGKFVYFVFITPISYHFYPNNRYLKLITNILLILIRMYVLHFRIFFIMAPIIIDFEKVCRLCFREDDGRSKMTSIYEQQDLEEIIYKCVQIEVSRSMLIMTRWLLHFFHINIYNFNSRNVLILQ